MKDNNEALYLWGCEVYRQRVDQRMWGQIVITLQDGKTAHVETRVTEKPPSDG